MTVQSLTRASFAASVSRMPPLVLTFVCVAMLATDGERACGESNGSKIVIREPAAAELQQPAFLTPIPAKPHGEVLPASATVVTTAKSTKAAGDASKKQPATANDTQQAKDAKQAATVDAAACSETNGKPLASQVNFQPFPDAQEAAREEAEFDATIVQNPCAALPSKPYNEYGIGIAFPAGELPTDFATACWESLNASAGPFPGQRFWATSAFAWDATCLCHRPLYFEESNLERYGYGCCETLQPAASAAHFFGTIPVLPYCIAVDCPGECIYTLGHYRPGSCNPKRYMWPPCSPRAILAEGGVWTGMVFLIP